MMAGRRKHRTARRRGRMIGKLVRSVFADTGYKFSSSKNPANRLSWSANRSKRRKGKW